MARASQWKKRRETRTCFVFWFAKITSSAAMTNATIRIWFSRVGDRPCGRCGSSDMARSLRWLTLPRRAGRGRCRRLLVPMPGDEPAHAVTYGAVGQRQIGLARGDQPQPAGWDVAERDAADTRQLGGD